MNDFRNVDEEQLRKNLFAAARLERPDANKANAILAHALLASSLPAAPLVGGHIAAFIKWCAVKLAGLGATKIVIVTVSSATVATYVGTRIFKHSNTQPQQVAPKIQTQTIKAPTVVPLHAVESSAPLPKMGHAPKPKASLPAEKPLIKDEQSASGAAALRLEKTEEKKREVNPGKLLEGLARVRSELRQNNVLAAGVALAAVQEQYDISDFVLEVKLLDIEIQVRSGNENRARQLAETLLNSPNTEAYRARVEHILRTFSAHKP